jgi:dipeptidyl aminopeptidase/acylaminoacyl peptidase
MLALGMAIGLAASAAAASPPLIPRELLFGNPERAQGRISPDGLRMSYLAPKNGVLNVWVKTIGKDDDKVVTDDKLRGIRIHSWAMDNKHILYLQDQGGNENWHIYAVDLDKGSVRDLTPFENVQAQIVALEPEIPNEMLVQMNKRDPSLMDLYRVDLTTGDSKLVGQNTGRIVGWVPDFQYRTRAAYASAPDGGFDLLVRETETDSFKTLIHWGPEDEGQPFGYTPDGTGLYIGDSRGADVTRLKTVDLKSGEEKVIASDPRVDVGDVMIHPTKHHIEAVAFNYDRSRWNALDPAVAADFEAIARFAPGEFGIVSRDLADKNWLVTVTSDTKPTQYYTYNRALKKGTFLFSVQPKLEEFTAARMEFVEIRSRDSLTLPSYLTLPAGVDPKNLPMILNVHGGPWARDNWGFNPEVQWMANRGYAVLQVNFRGSAGFGKKFLHAGDKEWGRKMQDDLTDAVKWAIAKGYADPRKIAIYGGSYGGYATLAGAAFTPDLYACGVDIVGPSNIMTLLASIPPYWEPLLKVFHTRVGDPATEEAMLKERSPLFSASKIRMPMLIGQGANDPRVKQAESEQIVAALKGNEQYVEYIVYPDEGHGFARPENRLDFYGKSEKFLAKYLGGRSAN